ncbi:MAG TPA: hypothetical protein VEC56_01960, partial [Candidatus Krumholzibacteria bacterium]|nr:hypothetical protein [Candidatus Krumholzibacteria bacterium]
AIHSDLGTRITTVSTWQAGYYIPAVEPGAGHIDLVIDSLVLQPNRYYLSMWISTVEEWYDVLDHCIAIDVEAADALDNQGRGLHPKWGLVFTPSRWSLGPPVAAR